MKLPIIIFVSVLYIHLFNAVAKMYFDSDHQLTIYDIYRKVVPAIDFHIQI